MKIFVINLAAATERRISAQAQLDEAGLEFQFLDGFSGAAAWRRFTGYDSLDYRIHCGRPAVSGEVGCYASHLALWHRCVELNEPIIVLEDDFDAQPDFAAFVARLGRYINDFGFIRLEETDPIDMVPVMNCGRFSLNYCRKYPHGATCYAISPHVAKEFVARSKILRAPVDKFIKKFWEHEQPLYSLQPAPVALHELALDSSMTDRAVHSISPGLRIRRMVRKTIWNIRRARFNARMMKEPQKQTGAATKVSGSAPVSNL